MENGKIARGLGSVHASFYDLSSGFYTGLSTMELILASSSPIRAQLLAQAGIEFTPLPARIDEEALRHSFTAEGLSPRDQADALAEMKALKLSNKHPQARVLGADQVLDHQGQALGKAADKHELAQQIQALQGSAHKLHSALVVYEAGQPVWRHVETVRMHMRPLSDGFIRAYVDAHWDKVQYCVGGYRIEAEGIILFDRIEGDIFAIQGMPLLPFINWLTIRQELTF